MCCFGEPAKKRLGFFVEIPKRKKSGLFFLGGGVGDPIKDGSVRHPVLEVFGSLRTMLFFSRT